MKPQFSTYFGPLVGILIVFSRAGLLSGQDGQIDYFGQIPPGDTPAIFAPGEISKPGRFEHAAIFSRDGKEFYFSVSSGWVHLTTYVRKLQHRGWTTEERTPFSEDRNAAEPTISYDNNRLVFTDSVHLWMVARNGTDWGDAVKLAGGVNTLPFQWHPTLARNGNLYFSYQGNIYRCEMVDGEYRLAVKLPAPVNSPSWNADAVIAPDESWIIFNSNRPGTKGSADLYISYVTADGKWTDPINLGPPINFPAAMNDPSSLSPDGKYFFYSVRTEKGSDIYWVSSGFIGRLRPKNAQAP